MITEAQKEILTENGYRVEKRPYYNPGGEVEYDTVIYPDGECQQYTNTHDMLTGHGAYLTLDEQWARAWEYHLRGDIPF